ncbi:MAG: class I SAM-dependent methyltransferase [Thermoplasmata archaeon]|nr:class I SAM-dependent methyltransferase [Thermoplasmata archaeon]
MSGDVEFDRIAPVYDETRPPPSEEEVRALAEILTGCRTILDAGVGTGRFAIPLRAHDFDVLGVDLSLGMMRRARAKGITRLVRADLTRLPFPGKVVDAAFMAHVLQLVPDPRPVLRELGRVARHRVVIVLPEWSERQTTEEGRELMRRYRELAAELGYSLPERGTRYRHTLNDLSAIAPPKEVRVVPGPSSLGLTPEERRGRWGTRMYGRGGLPPEVHATILLRLQAEHPTDLAVGTRSHTERFVAWDPIDLHDAI